MQNASPQSNTRLILSFGFFWIILSVLIWGIGISIGYPLGDAVGRSFSAGDGGYWAPTEQKTYLVNIVASLVFGLAMGSAQGFLFQKYSLLNGWRWVAGTLSGFLIVALLSNLFSLHYLPISNAVITMGGFDLPPKWLQQLSPWNRFLVGTYGTAEPLYLIWLAIAIGLFQWALQAPKKFLTAWWIVWNFAGLVIGFLAMDILTLFKVDDIFLLSILAGLIYGFITVWAVVFRLDRFITDEQNEAFSTA